MTAILLSVHVVAGIIFVGPITVAASMFPPRARQVLATAGAAVEDPVLGTLHRITTVYAVAGLSVPVFGIGTASVMGVLTDAWLVASMIITAIAAAVLAFRIVPDQAYVVESLSGAGDRVAAATKARTLSMTTGMFALLWVIVVVLMITRPGSTTGA